MDLRNHGKLAEIEGLDPPHDMVNAAKDLGNLVNSKGWDWPDILIGHSMVAKLHCNLPRDVPTEIMVKMSNFPNRYISTASLFEFPYSLFLCCLC